VRILITGGAGRLGFYTAQELREHRHDVVLFDTLESRDKDATLMKGDVMSSGDLSKAMDGCEAVIHLAGIPMLTPETRPIWRINAGGTLNVLECMVAKGVRRVVLASSICAQGFIFATTPMNVDVFPVDESYDGKPDDIYGLSKLSAELLCQGYVRRHKIEAVALRLATVWFPDLPEATKRLVARAGNPDQGMVSLWNYIDARDAAQAFRLAAEKPGLSFEIVNIGAAETCSFMPTADLVKQFYPGHPTFAPGFPRHAHDPLWNIERAKRLLGFAPRHTWKEYRATPSAAAKTDSTEPVRQ